ncbi:ALKBH8 [Symbiodinium sp. CCMP2456]|nr:ALKBH8 [Symbiodinium sp. CCMP2456]
MARRLLGMPRLGNMISSLLDDSKLAKVHPILQGLLSRTELKTLTVAEIIAEAQNAADLLGFSATNCMTNGYTQESQALRLAAGAALEDLVDLGLGEPLDGPQGSSGAMAERIIEAMDQLIIRLLEYSPSPDPARAWQCAQRGIVLARRSNLLQAARRFSAAAELILLQYPSVANQSHAPGKRRRLGKQWLEPCTETDTRLENVMQEQLMHAASDVALTFKAVDRLSFLSDDAFKRYSILRQPVVATCAADTLPALHLQQLVEMCEERQLQLMEYDPACEAWAKMTQVEKDERTAGTGNQSLRSVVQGWATGKHHVLFDHPLETACPELASRIRWPTFLESCDLVGKSPFAGMQGQDPFWDHPSLFVQPTGSQCGAHVDGAESQFIQLVLAGRKRWSFWPLQLSDQFKVLKRQDKLQLEVWSGSEQFRHQIRHDQIFPEQMPDVWRVDVEVQAGEMIVVPGGVPHMVTNLQDCIAVSRNFVDVHHVHRCADALRWPLPYHDLADFLEQQNAKTMVDTTSFAEQSVHFNQPAFDTTTMKVVLAYHRQPMMPSAMPHRSSLRDGSQADALQGHDLQSMQMQSISESEVMTAGPALEALMQLCHEGASLMALRTASRSFCGAAERVGRTGNLPRWPLVLMITVDEFVSKHRPSEPEFVIEFERGETASCTYTIHRCTQEDQSQKERVQVPHAQVVEFIRKLGRLRHGLGMENRLWALPKLQRRATLNLNMTPEEYAWSSMQVAMQCDPRASKRLVVLDAQKKVMLKHTFLDPDYVLPQPGRGVFRKIDSKGIHCDRVHRCLLRQIRDLCGNPNAIVDSCSFALNPPCLGLPLACGGFERNIFDVGCCLKFTAALCNFCIAARCHLNPKLAKAKLAAAQIAGEEIPQELIDAANEKPKEEEEPIVWEGRGERSCPLAAREAPKEPEKRPRDHDRGQSERERKPRRRRSGMDSRERHHASRSRSRRPRHRRRRKPDPDKAKPDKATSDKATPDKAEKSAKADARKLAAQKALAAMQEEMAPKPAGEREAEDEVEAVPNTELFVLGSSESYSYEDEEEATATKEKEEKVMDETAKAALEAAQAAEEEAKRQAEAALKAEEERKALEAQKEAEAEEARQAALREQEKKAKEEEVSLVRSSSQAASDHSGACLTELKTGLFALRNVPLGNVWKFQANVTRPWLYCFVISDFRCWSLSFLTRSTAAAALHKAPVSVEEAAKQVKGLHLYPDFLSEDEGRELADFLDQGEPEWSHEQFGVPTLYRVKHFGVLGSLRPRMVRLPDPKLGEVDLPCDGILGLVSQRLSQQGLPWSGCLKGFVPNEANVNDYSRDGSRLLLHWDDRGLYEECVCSVTVMGDCVMTFQMGGRSNLSAPSSKTTGADAPVVRVAIPPRSLLVLRGSARYEWQHGIPQAEDFLSDRRMAIIFRRVKGVPQAAKASRDSDSLAEKPAEAGSRRRPDAPAPCRAMVISTNWPDPDVSAAGRVTAGRLRLLRSFCSLESGSPVSFASPARPGNSQGKLSAANEVKCFRIKSNDEASVVAALESSGDPELVVFDGFNAEERFGHYVRERQPEAMRVLDMQDFHALRLGRERLIAGGADAGAIASYRPKASDEDLQRELASIHRCDATLAISEDERALLVETYGVPSWKVAAAPFGFPRPSRVLPSYQRRQGAMFIGNWRHRPNRDCAKWLIQEVWPLVRQRLPDLELSVYGANQTPEDAALTQESLGAYVRGYCRSVKKAMQQHHLLVAPLRYGAGVKGKVLEAMQHGLVVVTTPVGVEGIAAPDDFPGYVVETGGEDAEAFAEGIVEALRDPAQWEVQQQRAAALLAERFDENRLEEKLRDFLSERWQQLETDRQRDYVGQMLWHSSLRSTELMAKYIAAKEQARSLQQSLDQAGRWSRRESHAL